MYMCTQKYCFQEFLKEMDPKLSDCLFLFVVICCGEWLSAFWTNIYLGT